LIGTGGNRADSMFTTPECNRARNGNLPQAPVKSLFDAGPS